MASSSSSSPSSSSSLTALFPIRRTLLELNTDHKLLKHEIFNAICKTTEKPDGIIPPLVKRIVEYLEVQKEERDGFFGEKEWVDHFGNVPANPLPEGIEDIWQSPCPIYSNKKICETHIFVYLPSRVNGIPLTLNSLGVLAKRYFPNTPTGYQSVKPPILEKLGEVPIENSSWVLMAKKPLPKSGGKSFTAQQSMVANLVTKSLPLYQVPKTLDIAVCLLVHFASSNTRLFSDVVTRCQEYVVDPLNNSKIVPVAVGAFFHLGFIIHPNNGRDHSSVAIAAMRKFPSVAKK